MIAYILLLLCFAPSGPKFPCLPNGVKAGDIVSAEQIGGDPKKVRRVTVQDTLAHMHARCDKDRLLDRNKREIRFYRVECFGAATTYALETTHRQAEELEVLRAHYTVITMTCTPDGTPRP